MFDSLTVWRDPLPEELFPAERLAYYQPGSKDAEVAVEVRFSAMAIGR